MADPKCSTAATVTLTIHPVNDAPRITALSITPTSLDEDDSATLNGSFTDPDSSAFGITISWGDGSANTVDDRDGGTDTRSTNITVKNVAPVITGVVGPSGPVALGGSVTIAATFTDVGTQDTHTCPIDWDDGTTSNKTISETNGSGTCTGAKTYAAPGVYTISVTITDDDTGQASSTQALVVVYDPNGGFVTGGGWINSLPGAYIYDLALTGKANFGFVSKYAKGASVPTGQTEFQFHAASFNFYSAVYEVLVVNGHKAQYRGWGKIKGRSEDYRFILTAYDGQATGGEGNDKFRIKITDSTGTVIIYDNARGNPDDVDTANPQIIASGSIVIHDNKKT